MRYLSPKKTLYSAFFVHEYQELLQISIMELEIFSGKIGYISQTTSDIEMFSKGPLVKKIKIILFKRTVARSHRNAPRVRRALDARRASLATVC